MKTPRTCGDPGCCATHYAKAHCKKHYTQIARHGKLTPERERGVQLVCAAEACRQRGRFSRQEAIRGYCKKHARQILLHGRLAPEREHEMGHTGCAKPGCPAPHRAKGYCIAHYNAARWQLLKAKAAKLDRIEREALQARSKSNLRAR